MRLHWGLDSLKVRNRLVMLTLCISIISIITEYLVEVLLNGSDNVLLIDSLNLFSVNLEESVPTWYSTILLLSCAVLLGYIVLAKFRASDGYRWHWLGLAIGFVYLSIDEGAGIHEIFVDPIKQSLNTTGFFAFGWQIVAIPVVIVIGLLYIRFMLNLPRFTLLWLIVSAGFYLGGALIVEGISANLWDINSGVSMPYLAVATLEETFEMLGAVLFIYTLHSYMERSGYSLVLYQEDPVEFPQKSQPRMIVSPLLIGLIILTGGLLAWMSTTSIPLILEEVEEDIELAFYYPIEAQVLADEGVILDTSGIFGIDNPFSRQLGATLLEEYPYVMAVSQPEKNITTLIATRTILMSRADFETLLDRVGQTNFIIFGTETVKAISQSP